MDFKYDVALSFAGEDRNFVDNLANILRERGAKVFYDKFEEVDLWGKDLSIHFDYIYRRQSRYFIPFVSTAYKEKVWTNYEVRTAMARAIENKEEYILPVRFDDTQLDGLRSTIGYLDARGLSPERLAEKIMAKLGSEQNTPLPEKEKVTDQNCVYFSCYTLASQFGGIRGYSFGVTVTNLIKESRYFNAPYFQISQPLIGGLDTFQMMEMIQPLSFPVKLEYGQQYQVQFRVSNGFKDQLKKFKGQNVTITAVVTSTVGDKFDSNPMDVDQLFVLEK